MHWHHRNFSIKVQKGNFAKYLLLRLIWQGNVLHNSENLSKRLVVCVLVRYGSQPFLVHGCKLENEVRGCGDPNMISSSDDKQRSFISTIMGNQPSQPKITAQDRAIFQLKQQRDKLKQYQRKLNVTIDRQKKLAREALSKKNPEKAKFYLRSKKQQESTITKTYEQLDNLETLIGSIEFKLIEKDVLYGLQQGNQVLNKLNSEMSVDKIEKILDDLEDEKLKVDEVSDLLGTGAALSNSEEHEVDEEFDKLYEEVNGVKQSSPEITLPDAPNKHVLPDAPNKPVLPDAPNTKPKEEEVEEEEPTALAALHFAEIGRIPS